MADTSEFYDAYWGEAADQRTRGPMARHVRRLIGRALEGLHFRTVLDAGCGEGTLLSRLFRDRDDVTLTGTDISPLSIRIAAEKNPGVTFEQLDLAGRALDKTYDLVICSEVIEHIEDDEAAIHNLVRMTGRYLVVTTLGGCMRRHEEAIGHLRCYDPDELTRMLAGLGMKPLKVTRWGWPFFSPLYRNLLSALTSRSRAVTTGEFSRSQRVAAELIYRAFMLNSSRCGDQIVVLAEREQPQPVLTALEDTPNVSIVIPVRNEERFMPSCLEQLKGVDYPEECLEVIFADGKSTDRTVVLAREAGHTVVDNPGLKISAGRNAGFDSSNGAVVAFTDADCLFEPGWVRKAVAHLRDGSVAGVGGPTRVPADQNAFGMAVGAVFGLAGGLGTTVHHDSLAAPRDVDDLPGCNCFYRREALAAVMPTNSALYSNEDVEMNANIVREGYRLVMAPDVVVEHYKRPSVRGFWKQMHTFAIGRAQLGKRDRTFLKPGHLLVGFGVPLAAVTWVLWSAINAFVLCLGLGVLLAWGVGVFFLGCARGSVVVGLHAVGACALGLTAWVSGFLREMLFPSTTRTRMPPTPRG